MGQRRKNALDSPEWDQKEREFPTYRIRKDFPKPSGNGGGMPQTNRTPVRSDDLSLKEKACFIMHLL